VSKQKQRSRPRPARVVPAWEQPPPPEVLALIERFPAGSNGVLALRHVALFAVSGILARDWGAAPLLAYFGAELALVMLLNFACIAILPVALTDHDRTIVKGWAWFASVALLVAFAYASVEGWATLRDPIVTRTRDLAAWLRREHLLWPLAGDIGFWLRRGGRFHYWAGVAFLFRLWFCLAVGLFVAFFGWMLTQGMEAKRQAAVIVWLVFLGADLFATWVPVWLRNKAVPQGHLSAS
jgi:hypothetical protein